MPNVPVCQRVLIAKPMGPTVAMVVAKSAAHSRLALRARVVVKPRAQEQPVPVAVWSWELKLKALAAGC
jgi:hypothetical protein